MVVKSIPLDAITHRLTNAKAQIRKLRFPCIAIIGFEFLFEGFVALFQSLWQTIVLVVGTEASRSADVEFIRPIFMALIGLAHRLMHICQCIVCANLNHARDAFALKLFADGATSDVAIQNIEIGLRRLESRWFCLADFSLSAVALGFGLTLPRFQIGISFSGSRILIDRAVPGTREMSSRCSRARTI